MRFHKTLVIAVVETLQQIFIQKVYADKAVEQVLKSNTRWGSRDRRFIAETTYGMVRWWRFVKELLGEEERSTTDYYFRLFAVWQIVQGVELPDWEEFADIDKEKIAAQRIKVNAVRKYRESVPDWLDELAAKELGVNVWEREIKELNKEAMVVLRVNTLKCSKDELSKRLKSTGVEMLEEDKLPQLWQNVKDSAIVIKRQNVAALDEYKNGLFEIQDASSQLIAPFLQLKDGLTVIDACAGAGGKSLHIAAMMHNKGKVISMDVEERKLKELEKRANRAGATIVKTQVINSATVSKLKNTADRLLLDVPCSGLGVLRRNPDAKWKLSLEFIEQIKNVQQKIICNYSKMLMPGGLMVYATCSILPNENQLQVEAFLEKNKNFEFIEDRKVMASEGFDGFYMALVRRNS